MVRKGKLTIAVSLTVDTKESADTSSSAPRNSDPAVTIGRTTSVSMGTRKQPESLGKPNHLPGARSGLVSRIRGVLHPNRRGTFSADLIYYAFQKAFFACFSSRNCCIQPGCRLPTPTTTLRSKEVPWTTPSWRRYTGGE